MPFDVLQIANEMLILFLIFRSSLISEGIQSLGLSPKKGCQFTKVQVNNYEIVVKFFHVSHNLTWYSEIVQRFTRISKVCSTYELTKQFMEISVKNSAINLKKNTLQNSQSLTVNSLFKFSVQGSELVPFLGKVKIRSEIKLPLVASQVFFLMIARQTQNMK